MPLITCAQAALVIHNESVYLFARGPLRRQTYALGPRLRVLKGKRLQYRGTLPVNFRSAASAIHHPMPRTWARRFLGYAIATARYSKAAVLSLYPAPYK